jgi:hypothetical protein
MIILNGCLPLQHIILKIRSFILVAFSMSMNLRFDVRSNSDFDNQEFLGMDKIKFLGTIDNLLL